MQEVKALNLGLTDYRSTWKLQQKLFRLRTADKISDVLLLNEHHHVYTFGKNGHDDHLLSSEIELKANGAEIVHIDRGGDVTYHGPGQLVGYPVINLENYYPDVHRYLRDLEEVIIRTLAEFGIRGYRDESFTGVWVGDAKIAAIGVKVSHWVTMHGFAFNVNTDLSYFDRIIPCGIFHKGVTSMEQILGRQILIEEVAQKVTRHFGEVFGAEMIEREPTEWLYELEHFTEEHNYLLMNNYSWQSTTKKIASKKTKQSNNDFSPASGKNGRGTMKQTAQSNTLSSNILSKERLVDAYRMMFTARKTDDKILILLKQGKVFFHIGGSGHEAAQVATSFAMKPGYDWAYPYYRDLPFSLAFGYTVEEVFLEALHRVKGPSSAGFAMPFHWGHKRLRIVSQSSPTGTQYLEAVGTALGTVKEGKNEVVLRFIRRGLNE